MVHKPQFNPHMENSGSFRLKLFIHTLLCIGNGSFLYLDMIIRLLLGQKNDRLHMPWDNSVNKNAIIYAVVTTVLMGQFPLSKTIEWAALMASLPQTGIYIAFA